MQPFDFGETADLLGIHHQMVFTGQTPDVDTVPEVVRTCHNTLLECLGERHHDCLEPIFLNNPACQSADYRLFAKEQKNADFYVSMGTSMNQGETRIAGHVPYATAKGISACMAPHRPHGAGPGPRHRLAADRLRRLLERHPNLNLRPSAEANGANLNLRPYKDLKLTKQSCTA